MPYVHRYKTTMFGNHPLKVESFESAIYDFFDQGYDSKEDFKVKESLARISEFLRVYATVTLTDAQKDQFMEIFDFEKIG